MSAAAGLAAEVGHRSARCTEARSGGVAVMCAPIPRCGYALYAFDAQGGGAAANVNAAPRVLARTLQETRPGRGRLEYGIPT
jgi:hypothetical protein